MHANVETTLDRLQRIYQAAGPRLGCCFVEANVVLVLADLRGTTNFVLFEPTISDQHAIARLHYILGEFGLRAYMLEEMPNANGRTCRAVVVESLAGYAAVSHQTRMPGFISFDAGRGWPSWELWKQDTLDRLQIFHPDESDQLIYDRWIGVALGYPDQAIEDACECISDRHVWLSWMKQIELPAVRRFGGAIPNFRHAPAHANDLGILQTIATWEQLLEEVYASPWIQQLEADPAFQAARKTR